MPPPCPPQAAPLLSTVAPSPSAPGSLALVTKDRVGRLLVHLTAFPQGKLWMGAPAGVRDRIASEEAGLLDVAKHLKMWGISGMLDRNPQDALELGRCQNEHGQQLARVAAMKLECEKGLKADILEMQEYLKGCA